VGLDASPPALGYFEEPAPVGAGILPQRRMSLSTMLHATNGPGAGAHWFSDAETDEEDTALRHG
jgi:hypothetical protein